MMAYLAKIWLNILDKTRHRTYSSSKESIMSTQRKTMTLNLTQDEMDVLEMLATKKDVSKTAVLKAAIKLYYVIDCRIASGERIFSEDEKKGDKAELLLL